MPRRHLQLKLCALVLLAGLGGCTAPAEERGVPATAVPPAVSTTAPPRVVPPVQQPLPVHAISTTSTAPVDPRTAADRAAGVRSHAVPPRASGKLNAVGGAAAPPNPAASTRRTVSIEVEDGLDVDGEAFAAFVLATLNDRRSWAHDGYTFERVPQGGQVVVVLASPQVSQELCHPLTTHGIMSCSHGNRVTLTWLRWVQGQEEFRGDITAYRQYLINHEVGHSLGHGHTTCPGPGAVAPVMMQQTLGLKGCLPGPWPYPTG